MKKLLTLAFMLFLLSFNSSAQIIDIDPDGPVLECGSAEYMTRILVFKSTAKDLDEAIIHSRRWSIFIARYLTEGNPERLNYQFDCASCKGEKKGCEKSSIFISSDHLNPRNISGTWFVVIELVFKAKCASCDEAPWPRLDTKEGMEAIGLSLNQLQLDLHNPSGSNTIDLRFGEATAHKMNYVITTVDGKVLRQATIDEVGINNHQINTSTMQQGIYYISIVGEQGIWSESFVVR